MGCDGWMEFEGTGVDGRFICRIRAGAGYKGDIRVVGNALMTVLITTDNAKNEQ